VFYIRKPSGLNREEEEGRIRRYKTHGFLLSENKPEEKW
jgi:hypothetical protein